MEIDERPATRGENAKVSHDENRECDSDKAEFEKVAPGGLIPKLVKPDQNDEPQHESGDLRILPGGSENALDYEERIAKRFRTEEDPSETDERKNAELFD